MVRKGIHVMLVAMAGASMMAFRTLRYLSRYLARWYTAVSYTHLDVYKRQEMDEQKTLTLDLIKSLMEPAYTLIWRCV